MDWVFLVVLKYLYIIPALLFTVENWRIWYWNRYARPAAEAPMRCYPVVGGLFLFLSLSHLLPVEYGYAAYLALILDYGCLPLALQCLCRMIFRKKQEETSDKSTTR